MKTKLNRDTWGDLLKTSAILVNNGLMRMTYSSLHQCYSIDQNFCMICELEIKISTRYDYN